MARILVIGGAGYIGSHVAKLLTSGKKKHEVLVFDDLSTGFRSLVRFGRLKKGSLGDAKAIAACVRDFKPAAILHFANFGQVGESVADPGKYYRNNLGGTLNLLEAVRATKKKIPIVFSSSCAVYGEPNGPLDESHALAPVNPYGNCKKVAEEMLRDFESAYGIPSASLRYFNAAGADPEGEIGEMHEPESHLIPRLLKHSFGRQSKRDPVKILGDDYETPDGTCIRDYVHVMDLADAHVRAVDYLRDGGKSVALNLGSAHGYSVREIVRAVAEVSGKPLSVPVGPRRLGDPAQLVAVIERAKTLFGWAPTHNLESIVYSAGRGESAR